MASSLRLLLLLLSVAAHLANAQAQPYSPSDAVDLTFAPITLEQYLAQVRENNATIGGRRLGLQTATANKTAQSLPNTRPNISYSRGSWYQMLPYTPYTTPASNTYSLSVNVEGWGKREARGDYAQAEIGRSTVELDSTTVTIETSALYAYIDTLRNRMQWQTYLGALDRLNSLPSNPKTKAAEQNLLTGKTAAFDDLQYNALGMLNYSGDAIRDLPFPKGRLDLPSQSFQLVALVEQAQKSRVDVLSTEAALQSAEKNVALTQKNRMMDISPYVSYTTTPQYDSSGFTYTRQTAVSAGVSIPIPVNNFLQDADLVQASNAKTELEMIYRDLKVRIRNEVSQALLQYNVAKKQLAQADLAYSQSSTNPDKDAIQAITNERDRMGELIDAWTNHVKALINVMRMSGDYAVPKI